MKKALKILIPLIALILLAVIGNQAFSQMNTVKLGLETNATGTELENVVIENMVILEKRMKLYGIEEDKLEWRGQDDLRLNMGGIDKSSRESIVNKLIKQDDVKFILIDKGNSCETGDSEKSLKGNAFLNGSSIKNVSVLAAGNSAKLGIELTADSCEEFKYATIAASFDSSASRQIAIVINGTVIAAPIVTAPIMDGRVILAGGFSKEETTDIANSLLGGSLSTKIVRR